jgi:hypothetical protein
MSGEFREHLEVVHSLIAFGGMIHNDLKETFLTKSSQVLAITTPVRTENTRNLRRESGGAVRGMGPLLDALSQ